MAQVRASTRSELASGNLALQPGCPRISGDASVDIALWALWKIVLDIAQSAPVTSCADMEAPEVSEPAPPAAAAASPPVEPASASEPAPAP